MFPKGNSVNIFNFRVAIYFCIFLNGHFGNPDPKRIEKILKLIIILHFFKVFANKLYRNKAQCESTENGFFKGLGQFFKNSYL